MNAPLLTAAELPHRSVKEWVGKTADSRPPLSVRLRVLARYRGRCYLSGQLIRAGDKWDLEHVKPLHTAQPGENLNRESNMAPALKAPHQEKTARENSAKGKADRTRAKHLGVWTGPGRKFRKRKDPWGKERRSYAR